MGNKVVVYSAVLIGVYLAVSHATAGGKLLTESSKGAVRYVKALQGR